MIFHSNQWLFPLKSKGLVFLIEFEFTVTYELNFCMLCRSFSCFKDSECENPVVLRNIISKFCQTIDASLAGANWKLLCEMRQVIKWSELPHFTFWLSHSDPRFALLNTKVNLSLSTPLGGYGGTAPLIRNPSLRRWWVAHLNPRPIYPRHPLTRRLGGPQRRCGRFGEDRNFLPLPGIEPRLGNQNDLHL
jgi:hypothetical protein